MVFGRCDSSAYASLRLKVKFKITTFFLAVEHNLNENVLARLANVWHYHRISSSETNFRFFLVYFESGLGKMTLPTHKSSLVIL